MELQLLMACSHLKNFFDKVFSDTNNWHLKQFATPPLEKMLEYYDKSFIVLLKYVYDKFIVRSYDLETEYYEKHGTKAIEQEPK